VFLYESQAKCVSVRKIRRTFRCKFSGDATQSTQLRTDLLIKTDVLDHSHIFLVVTGSLWEGLTSQTSHRLRPEHLFAT
jgi:hypothetical protein